MEPVGTADPKTGDYVRAGDSLFDIAVDRSSGALYAVWQDSRTSGGVIDQVVFSKSTDGVHWSTPTLIAKTPTTAATQQSFTPSIDVSANGTIAVTYYDFRNWTAKGPTLPTDYWAITSIDGGTTWGPELRLTPTSFNGELAPVASGGHMIGDYEGLDHSGNTFLAAFEVANNAGDPTDIDVATFTH